MPRRNINGRRVVRGVAKRGRHRTDHAPIYVRGCPDCGFFEVSESAAFLNAYRRCPHCRG